MSGGACVASTPSSTAQSALTLGRVIASLVTSAASSRSRPRQSRGIHSHHCSRDPCGVELNNSNTIRGAINVSILSGAGNEEGLRCPTSLELLGPLRARCKWVRPIAFSANVFATRASFLGLHLA
eukprot:4663792-Amphidinium_carterae.1